MKPIFRRAALIAGVALLSLPQLSGAESASGAYLAGRQAALSSDFDAAARYYARALQQDRDNPGLMENLVQAQLSLGRVEQAIPVARMMAEQEMRSQIGNIALTAGMIAAGEYDRVVARDAESAGIGPLMDGLLSAWAQLGLGNRQEALARFDAVANQNGLRGFALYHKALALAHLGDYEAAEEVFVDSGSGQISRRGALARAEVLSQLGRNAEALEMMVTTFGAGFDPGLTSVADRLASGETLPFTHVTSVADGMAEVFFSVGAALNGEAADDYTLLYARVATYLRPGHIDALLLSAVLLDRLEQYELAVATYKQVPQSSPDYHAAELGRADALRRAGKPDAAIEVLERLALDHPTLPLVHSSLGDLFRQQERYEDAAAAYDRALEFTEEGAPSEWFLLYARGISHERLGEWDDAEADFRKALELNPDQPQVLNYLGYSLVEKQVKLDEALDMIQRAVAARPDSGYIVDSLGWVLYRLGRYDEAVEHMEKAVELMPIDPVVNDHLGDVYWAVGRKREAEFQWKRALSFIDPGKNDSDVDPDRIRRKLEVGLDVVLTEEGAPPLKVANGDD